jgi:hypothetical protein
MQVRIFRNWNIFGFFMIFLAQPCFLVASYDFEKDLSLPVLLIPITATWAVLIIAQVYLWLKVRQYRSKVNHLHQTERAYSTERELEDFKHLAWPHGLAATLSKPLATRQGVIQCQS